MQYTVTALGLTKKYGKAYALNGLDMHVPSGSVYGLIGRNGAGKTTLLRVLCGLQEQDGGEYELFGVKCGDKNIKSSRRRIGAIIEKPSLYNDITAAENLKIQAVSLGLPSYDFIPELLSLVGLSEAGAKKVRNFSLGMKQRLGIAVALTGGPDLIILDEPTNGLDPQGIVEMRELVLKLNREQGITFIISSHILEELSKLCTDYGFIDRGRIIKEINGAELDALLRKSTVIKVTETKKAAAALDKTGLQYKINADDTVIIYGEFSLSALAKELSSAGSELLSATPCDESLETYFIELTGGGKNE